MKGFDLYEIHNAPIDKSARYGIATHHPKQLTEGRASMKEVRWFGTDDARRIGEAIGIDWARSPFDVEQLRWGMDVELERGTHDVSTNVTNDDVLRTARIALAHLREIPDYYMRRERTEAISERR